MESKRKRSSNYTAQEIAMLLELVEKHRFIVEDKRSGAVYLSQKKEVWEKICNSFNAIATSGTRTIEQLKVLYDNKKQRVRKVLAEHNKQEYIKQISEKDICDAKKHDKDDKIQLKKTGGGSWCPTVSEHDLKVLGLIKNQVTPLPNTCDSAALYFGDVTANNEIVGDTETQEELDGTRNKNVLEVESPNVSPIIKIPLVFSTNDRQHENKNPTSRKSKAVINKSSHSLEKQNRTVKNSVNYKLLYFKRKCQNAALEKRKLHQEIRLRQKEHNLCMKEHSLKIKQMEEEHKVKMEKLNCTT